jgi:uncharacterized protein (UPF0371 family)
MARLGVSPTDRPVVTPAREAAVDAEERQKGNDGFYCGAALQLHDGTMVVGSNSALFHSASAALIKGIKRSRGRSPAYPPAARRRHRRSDRAEGQLPRLHLPEPERAGGADRARDHRREQSRRRRRASRCSRNCAATQMHLTHEPGTGDETGLRKLGISMTTDAASDLHAATSCAETRSRAESR